MKRDNMGRFVRSEVVSEVAASVVSEVVSEVTDAIGDWIRRWASDVDRRGLPGALVVIRRAWRDPALSRSEVEAIEVAALREAWTATGRVEGPSHA